MKEKQKQLQSNLGSYLWLHVVLLCHPIFERVMNFASPHFFFFLPEC